MIFAFFDLFCGQMRWYRRLRGGLWERDTAGTWWRKYERQIEDWRRGPKR
jgi:hypothetical protein